MLYNRSSPKVTFLGLAWALAFMIGCQGLTPSSSPVVVVERNKSIVPAWTGLENGRLYQEGDHFRLVAVQRRLQDLPLGLKVAQLRASSVTSQALSQKVLDLLPQGALARAGIGVINAEVQTFYTQHGKVADIYYERRVKPELIESEELVIYVLMQINGEEFAKFMADLLAKLSPPTQTRRSFDSGMVAFRGLG